MTMDVDTVTGEARTYPRSDLPTGLEIAGSLSLVPVAVFTCATVAPGFLLCVPGLLLAVLVISIPLLVVAAVGVLAALVVAVLATPYLLVRSMRRLRWPGTARARTAPLVPTSH
jgi:dolichol kinase